MSAFANLQPRQTQRAGMQVHAVPESERHVDSTGKRLPWAFLQADGVDTALTRQEPTEKGPFGRSNRRRGTSRSRSKTAEPRREEDRIRAENIAAEDAIFGRMKVEPREKEKTDVQTPKDISREPTEVLLYGFGDDLMWAAIEWYERVSGGVILEDYERMPPGKQESLQRSLNRATAQKSLSKPSLRRKNQFHGGTHWIKVTFDSAEAADLAIARSPHNIKGHLVYAEPYRGGGPAKDDAIYASSLGAQITSTTVPTTFSTNPQESPASETVSSATVNDRPAPRMQLESRSTAVQSQEITHRPGRIQGATRAVVLPAEQALLPKQARQSWFAWLGGGREVIASSVPKRENGQPDWARAGLYWRLFNWIDNMLGTDLCGMKGDD